MVPQNKKAIERLASYGLSLCPGPTSRPTLRPRNPTPVYLNIYDIVATSTNVTLSKVGCGIYHTGVLVYDLEWSYGEAAEMGTETGLFVVNPGSACGTLSTTLLAGETDLSAEQIDTLLHRMENEWRSEDYHLLHNNCNHFAEYFCALLTTNRSKPLRVPKWCNRAARVADCFVPQALATYVLHKMDGAEEPPKARTKVESNVADLPKSVIPRGWYLRVPSIVNEPRFQILPSHASGHMLSPQRTVSRFSTQWKVQGDAEQAGGRNAAPAFSGILQPTASAAAAAPATSEGHGGKEPPAHKTIAASANIRETGEIIGLKHGKTSSSFFAPPPPGSVMNATHEKENSVLSESSTRPAAVLEKSGATRLGLQLQQQDPLGPSVSLAKPSVTPLAASADFSVHLHSSSDDVELPSPLQDQPKSAPVNPKTLRGNEGGADADVYSDPGQQADQDEVLQQSCSEVFIPGGGVESDDTSRGGNDASPLRDSLRLRSLDNTTTDERPVPPRHQQQQRVEARRRRRAAGGDGRTADDEDGGERRGSAALATADNDATLQTFPADDDDVSPPRDRGLLSRRDGSRSLSFTLNNGTGAAHNTKHNNLAAGAHPSSSNGAAAVPDDQTSMRLQDEAQESPTAVDTVQHDVSAMQTFSRHMMNSDDDEDDSAEVDDSSTHQTEDRTVFTECAAAVAAAVTPAPGGAPVGRYARQGGVGGATAPRQPAAGEVDGSPMRPVRQLVQQYDSPE